VPETSHYWESWLYYENNTDKSMCKLDRINQCKQEFPLIYKVSQLNKKDEIVDYYNLILRKKYLK